MSVSKIRAMTEIAVPRREFSIEDPWGVPDNVSTVPLRRATDGAAPRLATRIAVYRDDCLNILFLADDDAVVATHLEHDAPLYEEDVVEVFLAPRALTEYFEIEVNPLGTTFDARLESPDGVRATMRTDLAWTAENLFAAVLREDVRAATIVRIPFANFGAEPAAGETWRANFFRIDRHPSGDEFSAWQPTNKVPSDFHVAAAFGVLRFE